MPPRSTKKPPASAARATRPGRGAAAERSPAKPTPAKQYRQIDGVRYDDKALVVADDAVKARGKIALSDARKVFESVLDGPGITRVEYDTLAFVANGGADGAQYRVVASAKAFLLGKMVDDVEDAATTVKKKKRKRVSLERDANSPTNSPAAATTKRKKTRETIVRRPETTPNATTRQKTQRRGKNAAKEKDASGSTGLKKRRRSSRGAADSVSDDTFSSDDAMTVVKKRAVKRKRASAERTPAGELKNRAVRFAETETKTADDDAETCSDAEIAPEPTGRESKLGSPLFSASPTPASPNTWLRRRSLSAEPGSPGHTAGRRETTAPSPVAPTPSAAINADARLEARHTLVREDIRKASFALFAVLERPVSARVAAAAVAGAFAASAVVRVAASLFFGSDDGADALEWETLFSRWADVESAAERLADALAAKRISAYGE